MASSTGKQSTVTELYLLLILRFNRHYFYTLRGEHLIPMTPKGWFRSSRHVTGEDSSFRGGVPSSMIRTSAMRKPKKKLIMSQSMVIDIDQNKARNFLSYRQPRITVFRF